MPLLILLIYPANPPPHTSYFLLATVSSRSFVLDISTREACDSVLASRLNPVNRLRLCERKDKVGHKESVTPGLHTKVSALNVAQLRETESGVGGKICDAAVRQGTLRRYQLTDGGSNGMRYLPRINIDRYIRTFNGSGLKNTRGHNLPSADIFTRGRRPLSSTARLPKRRSG